MSWLLHSIVSFFASTIIIYGPIPQQAQPSGSPGTTNLVAWYDMADASDAHAAFDLTETNSPAYTSGPPSYGTATDGTPGAYWSQSSLDSSWGNSSSDWSVVIRFRGYTSVSNGNSVFKCNTGRAQILWSSSGMTLRLCASSAATNTGVGASLGTWYCAVINFNASTPSYSWSINGSTLSEVTGITTSFTTGDLAMAAEPTGGDSNNIEIDYAGFFSRELTQDEVDWIYNTGGTRVYSDL